MNQKQKRSRALVWLIIAISVGPMLLAWILLHNTQWLSGRSNYGQLLTPAVTTERQQWQGIDSFTREHIDQLKGHWVLLNIIAGRDCNQVCLDALHKTKQIRLMLNKDLTRLRRAVVTLQAVDKNMASRWWQDDSRLLRLAIDARLTDTIKNIIGTPIADGVIMIMDPLGNLMMVYQPESDPYGIKKDLLKLLRASQIG